jgi:hypothetical protein
MKCRIFLCPNCGENVSRLVSDELSPLARLLEKAVTSLGRVLLERNALRAQLGRKEEPDIRHSA